MMTLYQLRKYVQLDFPENPADLIRLLVVWTRHDSEGELTMLFAHSGIDVGMFQSSLIPLLSTPSPEEDEMLTRCLLNAGDGPLFAMNILDVVFGRQTCRISVILTEIGCDFATVGRNMTYILRKRPGTLLSQGIAVNEIASPLTRYGRDLTEVASKGEFDHLCDRPEDLDRLAEILLRREKGNPAVTGVAGVGKTALVELFARSIVRGGAQGLFAGTRVFEVSMNRVVAGTKYRGDFEGRMEEIMSAVSGMKKAFLFIDEMHLIWGAGRAEGVIMDAANILKPFLTRGAVRVIGATTSEEFHRYITQDAALARRFQELRLDEPSSGLTTMMVRSQAAALSAYHGIAIGEEIVDEAIRLTDKHVASRFQPDKSIDLLDTACVNVIRSGGKELSRTVLADTLARQTGKSISSITGNIRASLRGLKDELAKRIIGQDDAIERVVATFIRRRQGLGSENKNLGSFLFAGETGVGKTELAKTMADVFFGKRSSLLTLDLAEFGQGGSVNRLIGSPAGYMGSEKDGLLASWLHESGTGVILFDEIDRAHPDVQELILGLLDTGRIMSARGERLDARQCVMVLTTNAVKQADLSRDSIGFARIRETPSLEDVLEDHFPREFLSRLDEQILFNTLGEDELMSIVVRKLDEAFDRLAKQDVIVTYDRELVSSYLVTLLGNDRSGARGIERLIEKKVIQEISLLLLHHEEEGVVRIELGEQFVKEGIAVIKKDSLPTN